MLTKMFIVWSCILQTGIVARLLKKNSVKCIVYILDCSVHRFQNTGITTQILGIKFFFVFRDICLFSEYYRQLA